MQQTVKFYDLGLIDYKEAWDLQERELAETVRLKVANRELPLEEQSAPRHRLFFCEHPHVFTLGKSGAEEHLLADAAKLKEIGATYYKINRGGDITYHGPGQLVGYPIFDLDHFFNDIHKYLRLLEESIILTCADYGLTAGRIEGLTGVWLDIEKGNDARKICAFGVRCSRWVTMHGFAFNVNSDLDFFNRIVPCGITDKGVTSLQAELGREVDIE
jgi:lipoyl(octanoyl) transferase